jgi:hypothetical protein
VSKPAAEPTGEQFVALHTARRDGREVVALRCVGDGETWLVECDVYPVVGMAVDPLRPGPYRFATRAQAEGFVKEAVLTLTYLGCEIS